MTDTAEDVRRKLTHRIYETPCPKCGAKLEFSEHTIALVFVNEGDPQLVWDFCNRHTFPHCEKGCELTFEEVIPRPAPGQPAILTRSALMDLVKEFVREKNAAPTVIAFTEEQWANVVRWNQSSGGDRPRRLFDMTLLGVDSPVFYLG